MNGAFERSEALLGDAAMRRLRVAHALVVGVGGVGSWCAEALVRTGVGRITLMDDDRVAVSNLNRQCPATALTLGQMKVEAMAARLKAINPETIITAIDRRYPSLDLTAYDVVIDAIDSVDAKAQLILDAFAAHVTVVSSMGAARRLDPTRVRLLPFDKVTGDGLAKALRNRFRKLGQWPGKFLCACSDEPPRQGGSVMFVTAAFGLALARAATAHLADRSPRRAIVALGSNIEPRGDFLAQARAALAALPETLLVDASDVEETEPVGVPSAFAEMKFLNQVLLVETALNVRDFAQRLRAIEDALGRVRTVRNGPRTIDVDLIDFDGLRLDDPALTLPHPRAQEREFVFRPWKDLIRRAMRAQRKAVPAAERAARSRALAARLVARLVADLATTRLVCCYEALKTELDLADFVAACRARGVEVVFPEEERSGDTRRFVVPRAKDVDLWICPGLAFTPDGARLGFGGGWYDRFLAERKPGAKAYGVAYDFQLWGVLPQGAWDQRLDGVIAV